MSFSTHRKMRSQHQWNRGVLNAFWAVSTVILSAQLMLSCVLSQYVSFLIPMNSFSDLTIVPTVFMVLLVFALEFIYRFKSEWIEPAIVVSSILMSYGYFFFIQEHYHSAPVVLIFPSLISILYFKKRYLILTLAMCLLGMAHLFIYPGDYYQEHDWIEIAAIGSILISTGLIGFGVIHRSNVLVNALNKTLQSEEDLRIQTVVMERMAKIDPLTGLNNHKTFHEYFAQLLEQYNRSPFPLQLAILDIDNFEQVNDTYGHWVGDIALKQVAACISDQMNADSFAARYGGEEFVILLCHAAPEDTYNWIERLRKKIALTPIAEMNRLPVTVSIGMHAVAPGETKAYCFQQADQALYESKDRGKNQTSVH